MPDKLDKLTPFDPTLAPEGYIAQLETKDDQYCSGCAFERDGSGDCDSRPCISDARPDGQFVIFIPIPPQQ